MSEVSTAYAGSGQREGIADRLGRAVDRMDGGTVTLGAVLDALGSTATGLCLLLFTLGAAIPGIAPLFGVALCAISLGMVLGHREPYLPARMRRWELDRDRLQSGLRRMAPVITWLERWLHPRAGGFLQRMTRGVGLAGLINAVLIVLPIPFGNVAPAIAMLLLALGLIVGDGVAVGAGLAATLVALALDIGFVAVGFKALAALFESIF